jgi:hypothetical protein
MRNIARKFFILEMYAKRLGTVAQLFEANEDQSISQLFLI